MNEQSPEEQASDQFNLLLDLTNRINSNLDLEEVLREIIEAAKIFTNSEACSVLLLDRETDELILSIPTGPATRSISGKRFPKNKGIAGWVVTHKKSLLINNVKEDERFLGDFRPDMFNSRSMICVPLINNQGEVIGALETINKINGTGFSEEELPLFQALANKATLAIENARLHEKIKTREQQLRESLQEKQALLSEVHHRVKNNLAVVSGILQLQSHATENEEIQRALSNSEMRIRTMALIHEKLYETGSLAHISFDAYTRELVESIGSSFKHRENIDLEVVCDTFFLNINQAVPCALILNEMVSNAFKHAFDDGDTGQIRISVQESKGQKVSVTVEDNGKGIPDHVNLSQPESYGLTIMNILAKQLKTDYTVRSENGTRLSFSFVKKDIPGGSSNVIDHP